MLKTGKFRYHSSDFAKNDMDRYVGESVEEAFLRRKKWKKSGYRTGDLQFTPRGV